MDYSILIIINEILLFDFRGCGKKKAIYKGYWTVPEDFQSILISNLMLHDHFPDALIRALSSLINDENNEDDDGIVSKDGEEKNVISDKSPMLNTFKGIWKFQVQDITYFITNFIFLNTFVFIYQL